MTELNVATHWTAAGKSFMKIIHTKGIGYYSPIDGSLCRVKVVTDEGGIIPGLDDERIKEITIGEYESEIECFLDACILTMKEQETCELLFSYVPGKPEKSMEEVMVSHTEENIERLINNEEELDTESKIEMDEKSKLDVEEMTISPLEEKGDEIIPNKEAQEDEEQILDAMDNKLQEEKELRESNNSDLELTDKVRIQLLCFTRQPEVWEMSVTEKWRRSLHHRERGVDLFVAGHYRWAFRRFGSALKYLISLEMDIPSEQLEDDVDVKGGKLTCYLNLAACHLKKGNFESVVKCCSKALDLDAYHPKALYRRGIALMYLQEYEKAQGDLEKAAEIEPGNMAIIKQQQLLKKHMQKLNHYYATALRKMFI